MSIISELHIPTEDAERIIKRLTNHWRHKLTIEQQDDIAVIHFSEQVTAFLSHTTQELIAKLKTENTEQLAQYQHVVLSHLNRMAHQEFAADWKMVE